PASCNAAVARARSPSASARCRRKRICAIKAGEAARMKNIAIFATSVRRCHRQIQYSGPLTRGTCRKTRTMKTIPRATATTVGASGITFVRDDLDGLRIAALQASTTALDHATTVGKDDVSVGTVEHLLSAVMAAGITDLDVHIDGPEVPIIDGSALPFLHLIDAAGVRELGMEVPVLRIREPIEVVDGEKSIRIMPANRLVLKYRIDFPHPTIGKQSFHFDAEHDNFARRIAPARTFGFMRDVEKLRAAGLARGGSVENCIVLDERGVM